MSLVTPGTFSPVHTKSFSSRLRELEELKDSKLVQIDVPSGMVDMFGRPYPSEMALWVHHFDDYGVVVEGTYEATLARKAMRRAGYAKKDTKLWSWRPLMIDQVVSEWPHGLAHGGVPGVAFYFEVSR